MVRPWDFPHPLHQNGKERVAPVQSVRLLDSSLNSPHHTKLDFPWGALQVEDHLGKEGPKPEPLALTFSPQEIFLIRAPSVASSLSNDFIRISTLDISINVGIEYG